MIPGRPDPSEYAPYASIYVDLVQEADILHALSVQIEDTMALLKSIDDRHGADHTYAPGKWTVKQVVNHIVDTERIMAYRALRLARNDSTPLPGFEQDDYVQYGPSGQCSLADFCEEFRLVRAATIALFRNLPAEAWRWGGVVNQHNVTVRGLAFVTAGHELHHAKILREKYLVGE